MIALQQPCFISLPSQTNQRVLIPGKAIALENNTQCTIEFEESIELATEGDVTLYAEWRAKFHQQAGKVIGPVEGAAKPTFNFSRAGEPVNCESRGCYRVSVVSQGYTGAVGPQKTTLLADVSVEGISVITPKPVKLGTMIEVAFRVEDVVIAGLLRVQGEKTLPDSRLRYGLYAFEKKSPIRKSLESLSAILQRGQLRRLARAA